MVTSHPPPHCAVNTRPTRPVDVVTHDSPERSMMAVRGAKQPPTAVVMAASTFGPFVPVRTDLL
jgi:hypothetical protein